MEQGKVAIGNAVAELCQVDFVAVFIGERPGLSSPEIMGIYTIYRPELGFADERRNCISNIHSDGLSDKQASALLKHFIERSFVINLSGVGLKIEIEDFLENKKDN
ncbi:ethanolamine ammonia-lyase light chain EutC [uncultured Maribacter sp.]|uniref:ethanolamine ammonia-lyase light chain EutC n=1 Tax=uncultured Maribacter sp. TaxID=431308 RepID=UPI0030EF5D32